MSCACTNQESRFPAPTCDGITGALFCLWRKAAALDCIGLSALFCIAANAIRPAWAKKEVEVFLTHLTAKLGVSPSTRNVASAAVLFLYAKVLCVDLPWLDDVLRAKPKVRVPVVLSRREVQLLIEHCDAKYFLLVSLMYGAGLRLMECVRLRVGDLDFSRHIIRAHAGNGSKDRITVFPGSLSVPMQAQMAWVRKMHEIDSAKGYGAAVLPLGPGKK